MRYVMVGTYDGDQEVMPLDPYSSSSVIREANRSLKIGKFNL